MPCSTIGATLTTGALVLTATLAVAQVSPSGPQGQQTPARPGAAAEPSDAVTLQGCLAQEAVGAAPSQGDATASTARPGFVLTQVDADTPSAGSSTADTRSTGSSRPQSPPQATGAREGTWQDAVERQPGRVAADAASRADADGHEAYRLVAAPGVDLAAHVGHRVEVTGRVAATAAGASPDAATRDSQDVQGGQMQDVGQTAQANRPRQPSQTGPAGQPHHEGQRAGAATAAATEALQQMFTVQSVRMLADSCAAR